MKVLVGGVLALVITILLVSFGCTGTTIQPGYVGIVVNQWGTNRGVQDLTLKTGRVYYNPVTETVIEYPTFMQTVAWTKNPNEGNQTAGAGSSHDTADESITFTTSGSTIINAAISISYQLVEKAVPAFYVQFRHGRLEDFTYGFMHNVARDTMNEVGGHYTPEQIMGDNEEFLKTVRNRLQTQLTPYGVEIHQFGFIGAPRPPEGVRNSINAAQQAKYLAIQKQNEILQAEAQAKSDVAKATGEAAAILAKAEGQAKANKLLAESLTPQVLERTRLDVQWHLIEKWNGQLPTTSFGGTTGPNLLLQQSVQK